MLSIVINNFYFSIDQDDPQKELKDDPPVNFIKVISLLAFTDLAFSVDSVTAAVAISDQLLLVITGALVGVVALRFTADYFIRWLENYTNLENAGYLAVALVAIKLSITLNLLINLALFCPLLVAISSLNCSATSFKFKSSSSCFNATAPMPTIGSF